MRPAGVTTLGQRALNRLFGVRLASDVHERAADFGIALPSGPRRRERLARIAARGVLFIHVPKNGGTSTAQALYGMHIGHSSVRAYRIMARRFFQAMPSFAVLRDPEARFLSACRHARAGATADVAISPAFRGTYQTFASTDAILDHIEAAPSPYALDNIFRTQSWYVKDRSRAIGVDHLVMLDDLAGLFARVCGFELPAPRLNRSQPSDLMLTAPQRERVRRLYAEDYALIAAATA